MPGTQNFMQAVPSEKRDRYLGSTVNAQVLVVSSETSFLEWIATRGISDCHLEFVPSGASAFNLLANSAFQVIILGENLPDLDRGDLIRIIMSSYPTVSIVSSSQSGNVNEFVSMRALHPIVQVILSLLNCAPSKGGLTKVHESPQSRFDFPNIPDGSGFCSGTSDPEILPNVVGGSGPMAVVSRLIRLVATKNSTVLLNGETGTGKERLARAIHDLSPRHRHPFIVVNCGAIPETLFESELFGYERGAFTGAQQSRMGKIQAARGGTLFLDEVGELPLVAQAKLLRFLQEREIQRLGSNETIKVDVRVIAATNADLQRMAIDGSFRKDLYYRLNVFPIALPPLRLRRDDVSILAHHFLAGHCRASGEPNKHFSAQTIAAMTDYEWPGNVRELEHFVERAFIFAESSVEVHCDIPGSLESRSAVEDRKTVSTPHARIAPSRVDYVAGEERDRRVNTRAPNRR
jgi:DNA-binding NtrC family response regulator